MSVLTTKNRIFAFFQRSNITLPRFTDAVLTTTSEEYMTMCIIAAFLLIAKERWDVNKKITIVLNLLALVCIWVSQFFYIWAISLPFVR
jgi:uncharacterized membrane protein YeiH